MSKPKEIITACRWSTTKEAWVGCPPGEVPPAAPPLPGPVRRYMLPSGATGRVLPHRLYRLPNGQPTFNPLVASGQAEYIKRWVPAYTSSTPPIGTRGAWVQISQGDPKVGVLHSAGMPDRMVTVLGYRGGHALVRYQSNATSNPPNFVVSTRRAARNPASDVLAFRSATIRAGTPSIPKCPKGMVWNHEKKECETRKIEIPDEACPMPPCPSNKGPQPNPEIGPLGRLELAVKDLFAGRARVVVDREGIDVVSNPGCIDVPFEVRNPGCC